VKLRALTGALTRDSINTVARLNWIGNRPFQAPAQLHIKTPFYKHPLYTITCKIQDGPAPPYPLDFESSDAIVSGPLFLRKTCSQLVADQGVKTTGCAIP